MLFKLPKEKRALPKEIADKVNKLKAPLPGEWFGKFDDCSINKDLYEGLLKKITSGSVDPDELNETIANKKALEETIRKQENELLQMISEPVDKSEQEKSVEKALLLYGRGTVNIRS